MSSLLVFAFTDEGGADRMIADLQSLQKQQLITIFDAASVIRKPDGKIQIKQVNSLVGSGAWGGAFWGMLIGLLFYMPWLGMPVCSIKDAMARKIIDCGISDNFIEEVGLTIRTGYSALFLMVARMAEQRIVEALARNKATLLRANLSKEDEINLREAFGAAEGEGFNFC
jgi:uncharacterized membrane protein